MPSESAVEQTNLKGAASPPLRGKVRDIYDLGETLLFVSTDRISAYDSILPSAIPGRGKTLNSISEFWFRKTAGDFPNHFISSDTTQYPEPFTTYSDLLGSRSMLVKKARPVPVECVVRGFISGSAWTEYEKTGMVCGIKMPAGLEMSQKLTEPIFTPATKAPHGERDMNITFEHACEIAGGENMEKMRRASLQIYEKASKHARARGIIIADTKFEFGFDKNGGLMFIDEMLTPDSSRFWKSSDYKKGKKQDGFDKQFVRDYLDSIKWDRNPPAPALPREVIDGTREKYAEMARALID